jgi:hypothetical protein
MFHLEVTPECYEMNKTIFPLQSVVCQNLYSTDIFPNTRLFLCSLFIYSFVVYCPIVKMFTLMNILEFRINNIDFQRKELIALK